MIEGASYRWPGRGVWGGVVVVALLWSHPAVAAPAPANQTFATYAVGAADPDALLEAAKAAAGPDATVSFDARQQRLLVLAPAAIQEQVAALVREAAPAPVNVRIEVQFRGQQRRQQSELSLGGGVGVIHEPGLTHTRVRVEPRIENQLTTESTDVRQVLVVASGREALLRVGEEVPALEWLMEYGLHQGLLLERVVWQQVGAFLVVQPWVLDDRTIRLRITPELRGLAGGRSSAVRFATATTEVVVPEGQAYPLAGLTQANDVMNRFLIGRSSLETSGALDITVTPRILKP